MTTLTQMQQKELAATHAIHTLVRRGLIHAGMKIGLGTGSTALPAVRELAKLLHAAEGGLSDITAAATSFQTEIACEELGIPVYSLNNPRLGGSLDLAIDGADEIDPQNRLIKGGGAALLREKIIAYNAKTFVIVADESKAVATIATAFAVPVEIIAEARISVTRALEALGAECILREGIRKCGPVITDNGNLILDCRWSHALDPSVYEAKINGITGVVENGFFTGNQPIVFIGKVDGSIEERER